MCTSHQGVCKGSDGSRGRVGSSWRGGPGGVGRRLGGPGALGVQVAPPPGADRAACPAGWPGCGRARAGRPGAGRGSGGSVVSPGSVGDRCRPRDAGPYGPGASGSSAKAGAALSLPRAASGLRHPRRRPRRPVGPRGHRRRVGLTGRSREILVAGVRAAAQLAAVSLLIGWVVRSVAPLLGFVALMFAVAVWTAGRRIAANRTWRWAAVPIGAGGAARRRGAAAHGARAGPGRGAHPGGGHPHRRGAHRDRTRRAACAGRTRRPARGGGGGHGPTRTPGWRSSGRRRRTRCRPGSIRPGPSDSSRCRGRSWACCWAAPHPWRRAPCSCSSWWALVALMAVQVVAVAMVLELVARGLLYRD